MTNLNNTNTAMTMSSREIAELTGKEHRNVLRDIRTVLVELGGQGGLLSFEHTYRHPQNGLLLTEYLLPRREVEILLTGYSVKLRAKVIDRLRELEQQVATPALPTSYIAALESLVQSEKAKEALRLENESMKPDAEVGKAVGSRKHLTIMSFIKKLPGVNKAPKRCTQARLSSSVSDELNQPKAAQGPLWRNVGALVWDSPPAAVTVVYHRLPFHLFQSFSQRLGYAPPFGCPYAVHHLRHQGCNDF